MIAFLQTAKAENEARKLLTMMRETGSYSVPASKEYPIADLRDSQMFGVLIAKMKDGNERTLFGYSGSIKGSYEVPGFVPPCFSFDEFKRIVAINDKEIHDLTDRINAGEKGLEKKRAELSNETLKRLQDIFVLSKWDGTRIHGLPSGCPTGTGECAGLKLINYALRRGWEIVGLAEFQMDGTFNPPCEERCGILLERMLGLRFLYADEHIAVINKPAGLLSVPGRGIEKLDSASHRFHTLFPSSPKECYVHRLDMDTSGLLVMAFTKEAHKKLSLAFEKREVQKTYVALLEGVIKENGGVIDLPMRLDVDNRPYQIVDFEQGKRALTRWEKLHVTWIGDDKYTRVRFYPETGRTHQLRVHAASGLKHPIKGDRLYGNRKEGERLCLHAEAIAFKHPITGEEMSFTYPAEF